MGGFFFPPAFVPGIPPIPLGSAGTILTMVGGLPVFTAGSGITPALGDSITYASPAGVSNNVNPTGFDAGVGAIIVTLAGGNATWTGLIAGVEGQTVRITNGDAANSLTLDAPFNAGSSAANQFQGFGNQVLLPNMSVLIQYRSALGSPLGSGAWSLA